MLPTREALYRSMYLHDEVYCPPQEEGSALLEVTQGCSWGKCAFCDFARDPFLILPRAHIERNLDTLAGLEPEAERMFFLGENVFVLETPKLSLLMALARGRMPRLREFAMYARTDDILRKPPAELAALAEQGLSDLYLGVESGSDPILLEMNKGVSAEQTLQAMQRLDEAGIGYAVTIILGLGGRAYRNLHAIETARLLNRAHPKSIWALALKLWPGTPLERLARRGQFEPMSPRELLFEERLLLENLSVDHCTYLDSTVMDVMTVQGELQRGKGAMLGILESILAQTQG